MDVVVFPQSGYANRLQAMASAKLLADELDATWHVCWQLQPIAPAAPDLIFSEELLVSHFVSTTEAAERWGLIKEDLPLYLTDDSVNDRVVVAGHDRGEQALMPDLRALLADHTPSVVAIVAGGKFTIAGDRVLTEDQAAAFRARRSRAYADFRFSQQIEGQVTELTSSGELFLGLHLRYSDRAREAPWRRRIWPAVRQVSERTGIRRVFVASDNGPERDRWVATLRGRGLEPWTVRPRTLDRSDPTSALGALVDWGILARSSGMAYFAASSFAEEASVASGCYDASIGLRPSATRSAWIRTSEYIHAGRTYPRRHGWLTAKEE